MIFITKKRLHAYINKRLNIMEKISEIEGKIVLKREQREYYLSVIKNYSEHLVYLSSILKYHEIEVPPLKPINLKEKKCNGR